MSRNYTIKMFIFMYMIDIELNYVPLDDAASTTSSVNLLIFQRRRKNFLSLTVERQIVFEKISLLRKDNDVVRCTLRQHFFTYVYEFRRLLEW